MKDTLDRREFLKFSASAGAALYGAPLDLRTGSPKPMERKGAAKRVIVVGAGLAGLSAAYELTQAGHDVTVLEAQMRPGGRVLTLREPFSDGLYAEAGAARIPDNHDLTLKYVRQFGLTLDPFYPSELASVVSFRGRRFTVEPGEPFDLVSHYPFDLTAAEKQLGGQGLWNKYLDPVVKEMGDRCAADWPPESAEKYDWMTSEEFLQSRGASPGAIEAMMPWREPEERRGGSALLRAECASPGVPAKGLYKIRGGTDLLPRAFAARLANRIHYGAPVVRIEHDPQGVRVIFSRPGAPQVLVADRLICAIPFSVLRHVEVSPPFTPEKQRAVDELPYASAVRIYLQVKERYWAKEGLNGFARSDALGEVWHPTFDQPGPRGILLSFLTGRIRAGRVTEMTESERIDFAVEQMDKIYPGLSNHVEGGTSKAWDEDPWARGCFSYLKPGQVIALVPHLARSEGRIHFAGDHTTRRSGWMQGALESGNRAAREINEAS